MARSQPLHEKIELHFAWLGVPISIVVGAGAWLGVPGLVLPICLLAVSLAVLIPYIWIMLPWSKLWRSATTAGCVLVFCYIAWLFWFVFSADMRIVFLNGAAYPSGSEQIDLAVAVTNRGKNTSLTQWKAILKDENGNSHESVPLTDTGDWIRIETQSHNRLYFANPDCDLRYETARALQSGDTVYGVLTVLFPDYPARPIGVGSSIQIRARDMLGRTVKSPFMEVSAIQGEKDEIFACKRVAPPATDTPAVPSKP